jgi:hypothetical protein
VWLRLEWRALAKALILSGEDRKRAVSDAVAFRLTRRSQFAKAAENERAEEIGEGLAQYTGTVTTAASRPEAVASAILHLAGAEGHETFLQQSYTTGVGYAILLDDASPDWRRRVRSDSDLGQMLMAALDVTPVANAVEASARYGGVELRAAEQTRAEQRRAVVRELQNRFVDGPVLRAWMYEMSVYDAPTFVAVAALLIVVALVASWLPARRASRVDPVQALRAD